MNIYRKIRHRRRYRQIIQTLLKHGLGYFVHRLGLESVVPLPAVYSLQKCQKESDSCMADKLTNALMELGPTFIKFGQLLSTRSDILSPAFIEELEKLQDKVLPFPVDQVKAQIAAEIGPVEEIFAEFNPVPLAAASIGQVHRARLKSGEEIIVKVQRPGIENLVEDDLQILIDLAGLAEKRSADARQIGIQAMIEDYAKILRLELDYEREAKNTERMRVNFAADHSVVIPRVFAEYSTRKILTEEFIDGVKLSDFNTIQARGWNRNKISRLGTRAFLTQVMMHGFFQADPHPGNMMLLNEDKIAFIDFGEIGLLTEKRLTTLGQLLVGIDKKDLDSAMSALYDMGILNERVDLDSFEADFSDLIERVYLSNMGSIDADRLRREMMDIAYRYQLRLPNYLTALMKALITVDGVGKRLDPNFNISEVAGPIIREMFIERIKPEGIYRSLRRNYYREIKPLFAFPRNLNHLVKVAGQGDLEISHKHELKKSFETKITQVSNRISASLIIAGGLISTSLLLLAGDHSAAHLNRVLMATSGFAILMGLYAFLISGRRY